MLPCSITWYLHSDGLSKGETLYVTDIQAHLADWAGGATIGNCLWWTRKDRPWSARWSANYRLQVTNLRLLWRVD